MPVLHVPRILGPSVHWWFGVAADLPGDWYDDSAAGQLTLSGSAVQSFVFSDSGTGTLSLAGSGVWSQAFNDSRTATLNVSGARTESETHSRSGAATITAASGGVSESHIDSGASDSADSQSIEFTIRGTAAQSVAHTAAGSGSLTVSGTGLRTSTHTATGSGTLSLTGTRSESASHTQTATGHLALWAPDGTAAAYPGAFYPGQVYPGQPFLTFDANTHTATAPGTITFTGTATEGYTSGGTVYTDTATGALVISGLAIDDPGAPPTYDIAEGTIFLLSGSIPLDPEASKHQQDARFQSPYIVARRGFTDRID